MSVTLRNGHSLPVIGFGTYLLSSDQARRCVLHALRHGYRCIDTAEFYNNHEGIAEAIRESNIPREEIFIIDKLNPAKSDQNDLRTGKSYEEAIETFHTNRKRLQVEYVDLYLIHHAFSKKQRVEQYKAFLHLQEQGYIREIGVSNWDIHHIEELKTCGLADRLPAVDQIEIHPLCLQTTLIEYLKQDNIQVQAYSSLAPLGSWRVAPGQNSAKPKYSKDEQESGKLYRKKSKQLEDLLVAMSSKYHVTQSQILLKWALQHGYPILPKVRYRPRWRLNLSPHGYI